jgi:hypothetical protein
MDSILRSHGELRRCVACCAHCGIRFLTHPRNAGRRDLRCPFGCRQHHRRQCSGQRSTAYYRTAAGKRKKKRLNARRQQVPTSAQPAPDPPAAPPGELRLEETMVDESSLAKSPMLPYVRMIVSLIEGVELSCGEVLCLLRRAMRQHSISARRRIDYILGFVTEHPP